MSGAEAEFEELIREHARLMGAAIRRVCRPGHRNLVPDVEQEVYMALWKLVRDGKKIEHPVSYLYKMAMTTALDLVRKQKRQPRGMEDEEFLGVLDERAADPPDHSLELPESRRMVEQLLQTLEPDRARALRAYLSGFGHKEVAELYGWSESVARHRIYRSLKRLREKVRSEREILEEDGS